MRAGGNMLEPTPNSPPPSPNATPGSFDVGDGNFKRGRFKPIAVLVGLVAVLGAGLFLLLGVKQEADKLTVEQAMETKKGIFILPRAEQLPKWRDWAKSDRSPELRQEALKQLAWAKDPEGVDLAIAALTDQSEPIQAMAGTALAGYGSPLADKAKDPLLAALKTVGPGAKPQVAWALVVLGEARAFEDIMVLYRAGHLSKVQRLGGGVAFDPERIVQLIDLDKLASYHKDESGAVRQLVATVLSRNADPKYTDQLIALVQDKDAEIARQAAPGLGKIGDQRAREPLLAALRGADKESRKKYLFALRDGIGTEGLVLAFDSVDDSTHEKTWFQTKQIMDITRILADPRGGDSLEKWIEDRKPHHHWETEAAVAMAEVGDVRAVPYLAKRLRMDPTKVYKDDYDHEQLLKRDDNERVVAARMIADLALLHPDKRAQIREQAEDAVQFWITEMPSPHANGLRALAAMESTKYIAKLRKWADPDVPLPKEGQQPPFPEEWVIAQSAMRYVGWMKDEPSWKVLDKALKRRPSHIDVTMDGLMQGGKAILGMSLRAIGVGAAHGFSQWQDPKAFKSLLDYVEEPMENEQSRMEACAALAWVGSKEDMLTVAKKIEEYNKPDRNDQFRRACLLEAFVQRPVPGTAPALLGLLTPESAIPTRHQAARAIGKAEIDSETEAKLFEMMNDDALRSDAALALLLGGSPDVAARAVAMYADKPKAALEELGDLWFRTFGYWSKEDLESGRIFRWVDNAVAVSRVEVNQTAQEWATVLLMRQFDNLLFDNGPHSFTRPVLRHRLLSMAKDESKKELQEGAIRTLKFMNEQGVLLALKDEKGSVEKLASEAYFELMNPKVVTGVKVPELESKKE
jgi:HEAT repeat protein